MFIKKTFSFILLLGIYNFSYGDSLPKNLVAFMSYPGGKSCPDNWSEAQYAAGRLILATDTRIDKQISMGEALKDQEVPIHFHQYKAKIDIGDNPSIDDPALGKDEGVAESKSYTITGNSVNTDSGYPFIQYLICEHQIDSTKDNLPYGTIAFFNSKVCPNKNWQSRSNFNGRFFLPTPSGGRSGTTVNAAWENGKFATHIHGLVGSITIGKKGFVGGGSENHDTASKDDQPLKGALHTNTEPTVPFVTLLACEKFSISDTPNQGLTRGTTLFFGQQDCPNGWQLTSGAPGRFFVGMPTGGTQGAAFGGNPMTPNETYRNHRHIVNGTVDVEHIDTDFTQTWKNTWFGKKGNHAFTALSEWASLELPYMYLTSCTYTGTGSES